MLGSLDFADARYLRRMHAVDLFLAMPLRLEDPCCGLPRGLQLIVRSRLDPLNIAHDASQAALEPTCAPLAVFYLLGMRIAALLAEQC